LHGNLGLYRHPYDTPITEEQFDLLLKCFEGNPSFIFLQLEGTFEKFDIQSKISEKWSNGLPKNIFIMNAPALPEDDVRMKNMKSQVKEIFQKMPHYRPGVSSQYSECPYYSIGDIALFFKDRYQQSLRADTRQKHEEKKLDILPPEEIKTYISHSGLAFKDVYANELRIPGQLSIEYSIGDICKVAAGCFHGLSSQTILAAYDPVYHQSIPKDAPLYLEQKPLTAEEKEKEKKSNIEPLFSQYQVVPCPAPQKLDS
jgi:hypothetical protein